MTQEPANRRTDSNYQEGEESLRIVSRLVGPRAYRVGELWRPGVQRWEPDAIYNLDRDGHSITLIEPSPSRELIDAVASTPAELALIVQGPLLVVLCHFPPISPWFSMPYSWPLRNRERAVRVVPPLRMRTGDDALLWVSLVDADSGVILAQRGTVMSHSFTKALHEAIRAQIRAPFVPDRYIEAIGCLGLDFVAGDRLVARARFRTGGGA